MTADITPPVPDQAPSTSTGAPNPLASHPPFPESTAATTTTTTTTAADSSATSSHGREGHSGAAAAAAQLSGESLKQKLKGTLRHFADFPIPGIDFVDIMPLFADADAHATLLAALELQALAAEQRPDVIVGLDARGFLFGPGLALRLGVGFAPVRKKGKLPGPCVTAAYEKEYGTDLFQMQQDAVKPGQKVLIVDDIIATGGSAKAAAELVQQLGGEVLGFLFILEIPGLNGREKLGNVPTTILIGDA